MLTRWNIDLASEENHLLQILALQQKNLARNISADIAKSQGFVSIQHDLDTLTAMNHPYQHVIAKHGDHIVGYALVMLPKMKERISFLNPMFKRIQTIKYNHQRIRANEYFVMGQICIDEPFRSKGIFSDLYQGLKAKMQKNFLYCITEVSSLNQRSLRAHIREGFEIIDEHKGVDGGTWKLLLWNMHNE